jgi:AcrR family transcriptional regulator
MSVMGTKSVPRAEREQQMLDSAEQVFGKRGYQPASMNDIAAGAGISKAMLYSYFESKEQLYVACVERYRARLFERAEAEVMKAPNPAEGLEAFARVYFDHIEEWRETGWWVLYGEASTQAISEMRARNAVLIELLLRRAAELVGSSPSDADIEFLAFTLVGAGELAGRWWLEHSEVPKQQVVDRFTAFCRPAIAAALVPTDD